MLRVLIAEDEEMIRKGLVYTTGWLPMDCVVVTEAADSRNGYGKVPKYRPDVVTMDIYMPFIDDIEMIRKASKQVRSKSALLTSYVDLEYARRAIKVRVYEYLLKPVDEGALADIVKRPGEEIVNSHQAEHVMEQARIRGGNLNLEYYIQLDLSENQYASRTTKAIRGDSARKLNVKSISNDLGVSASCLSRKFKEVTGQAFLDLLSKYRVRQTIVVLGTRQYRISEISKVAGFMDYKHLCSVFKKYTSKSSTKFTRGVLRNFVENLTIISMDEIALTLERSHDLCWIYQK